MDTDQMDSYEDHRKKIALEMEISADDIMKAIRVLYAFATLPQDLHNPTYSVVKDLLAEDKTIGGIAVIIMGKEGVSDMTSSFGLGRVTPLIALGACFFRHGRIANGRRRAKGFAEP